MNPSEYWRYANKYSLLEVAYLVHGLEPQRRSADHPQRVINVFNEMRGVLVENQPEMQHENIEHWEFGIDFVRGWAAHINETDFFKLEPTPIEKPLTESEREKLLKQIGVMALVLSKLSGKYKLGEKPNQSQIASAAQGIVDSCEFTGKKGTGSSEIRASIAAGLKLLQDDD